MTRDEIVDALRPVERLPARIFLDEQAFAAFREARADLGPCHRIIDRWRYDLGWTIDDAVALPFLRAELEAAGVIPKATA